LVVKKGFQALGKKCWWTILVRKKSCNQGEGLLYIHQFNLVVFCCKGGRGEGFFFFFPIVLHVCPSCSQSVPKYIPKNFPNSTLVLFNMVCPKFDSHVHKLKRWATGQRIHLFLFCNWGPKRCSHWGVLHCSKAIDDE
jgi:hypothetical protein